MKHRYAVILLATLSLSAPTFAADNGEALFKKSGCAACHSPDKKLVGPAFKDVAAKYAGDKEAQARLEQKVRSGGSGSFGSMPMPATPAKVSDGDIKEIVSWVLSQK